MIQHFKAHVPTSQNRLKNRQSRGTLTDASFMKPRSRCMFQRMWEAFTYHMRSVRY